MATSHLFWLLRSHQTREFWTTSHFRQILRFRQIRSRRRFWGVGVHACQNPPSTAQGTSRERPANLKKRKNRPPPSVW